MQVSPATTSHRPFPQPSGVLDARAPRWLAWHRAVAAQSAGQRSHVSSTAQAPSPQTAQVPSKTCAQTFKVSFKGTFTQIDTDLQKVASDWTLSPTGDDVGTRSGHRVTWRIARLTLYGVQLTGAPGLATPTRRFSGNCQVLFDNPSMQERLQIQTTGAGKWRQLRLLRHVASALSWAHLSSGAKHVVAVSAGAVIAASQQATSIHI